MKLEQGSILRSTQFQGTVEIVKINAFLNKIYVRIQNERGNTWEEEWNYQHTKVGLSNNTYRIVGGTFYYKKLEVAKYEVGENGKRLFLKVLENIPHVSRQLTEQSIFEMLKIERYPKLEDMAYLNWTI